MPHQSCNGFHFRLAARPPQAVMNVVAPDLTVELVQVVVVSSDLPDGLGTLGIDQGLSLEVFDHRLEQPLNLDGDRRERLVLDCLH